MCNGIIDYFGKRLKEESTQKYLDEFFGNYFKSFTDDFVNNLEKYDNFLLYCKEQSKEGKYDENILQKWKNPSPVILHLITCRFFDI